MAVNKEKNSADTYFALVIAVLVLYALFLIPNVVGSALGEGPLEKLKELNHLGDLLSGVFAPVAFIFFVISVLIQREEFRLAREEMKSSRDELSKQVAQLRLSAMSPILINSIEKNFLLLEVKIESWVKDLKKNLQRDKKNEFGSEFFKSYEDSVSHMKDFSKQYKIANEDRGRQFLRLYGKGHPDSFYRIASEYFSFSIDVKINMQKIKAYRDSVEFLKNLYFDAEILQSENFSEELLYIYLEGKYIDMYKNVSFIIENEVFIECIRDFHNKIMEKITTINEKYSKT
jgi:hypothetical protein